MNDFEGLLSERLNDLVDHETGPERPAPRFVPAEHDDRSKARPWLLAAAVIILAVGVSWASISWITRSQTPPVASPSSAVPSPTTPAPSTSSSASATPTSAKPSSASSSTAALAGGARIAVPAGWKLTVDASGTNGGRRWWCLNPASGISSMPPATAQSHAACVISVVDIGQTYPFADPNGLLGFPSELPTCSVDSDPNNSVGVATIDLADTRSLGGRAAQHSRWTLVCPAYTLHSEQYLVPTAANWAMYTDVAEATFGGVSISSVMSQVASSSVLPSQTSTLWMSDRGFLRSVTKNSSGMTITVDRYQDCAVNQYVITNTDTATTTYVVPSSARLTGSDKFTPGAKVAIYTDGTTVTEVDYLDY